MEHVDTSVMVTVSTPKQQNEGTLVLRGVTRADALKRGMLIWLGGWGLAILTLPIPIVHMLAPPVLLVLAPIAGRIAFKLLANAKDVLKSTVTCPDCNANCDLKGRDGSWPIEQACSQCQAHLLIRPA